MNEINAFLAQYGWQLLQKTWEQIYISAIEIGRAHV